MLQKFKELYSLHSVAILFVALVVSEAIFKVYSYLYSDNILLLRIVKGSVLVAISVLIYSKNSKLLLLPFILIINFCLGQSLLGEYKAQSLVEFGKFMFPIMLLIYFNENKLKNEQKVSLFKAFEAFMVVNGVLIILGFLFQIDVLRTYEGTRFGYNGLLVTSATSTYVYALTVIYLFAKYKQKLFSNHICIFIVISIVFVGTKSLYLFIAFFIGAYLWKFSSFNKVKILGITIVFLIAIMYVLFFRLSIFSEIRQEEGFLTSIMSYRDLLLQEKTLPYIRENWGVLNYFFGGVSDLTTKSQMDMIDVFYFFGIAGGFLYLYMFLKHFLAFKTDFSLWFLLSVLLIIVFLAGNFFSYPSIAIYLVIVKEYLNSK